MLIANKLARREDASLHGADAIHVAMVIRSGALLATLDARMKSNARKMGVDVV